ncbi:PREDICTED: chromobox protein homolog 6-like [Tinamus guttatus]|uniref:chromobox protein homolog 6-like n=1 Tax=Tinamus guttatus TaxID=94827 RepID=UPI00052EE49E|nr:PREDICTED: chromobox protein homolog 6-like [Tinamus guttatus]
MAAEQAGEVALGRPLEPARAQAEALHIGDVHFSVKPGSSTSSPKLHSSAAVHRLKKDIRRCHRMSRLPGLSL